MEASRSCPGFTPLPDFSGLRVNAGQAHPKTTNVIEFKLAKELTDDGFVIFHYRSNSHLLKDEMNGAFILEVNSRPVLREPGTNKQAKQHRIELKKGWNHIAWQFSFSTAKDYSNLFVEITASSSSNSAEDRDLAGARVVGLLQTVQRQFQRRGSLGVHTVSLELVPECDQWTLR